MLKKRNIREKKAKRKLTRAAKAPLRKAEIGMKKAKQKLTRAATAFKLAMGHSLNPTTVHQKKMEAVMREAEGVLASIRQ